MVSKEIKLHIFGASGSGITTLGKAIAKKLNIPIFNFDDYYWEKTNPPFQKKREHDERYKLLIKDIGDSKDFIISGHYGTYVECMDCSLTHAIFIYTSSDLRIERLKRRELRNFGERVFPDGDMHKNYVEFIEWAKHYEESNLKGRSLKQHEERIAKLECPILHLDGDKELEDKVNLCLEFLE